MQTRFLTGGLAEIADRYDGFILDLWGTIHDGYQPLPGAIPALEGLKGLGKPVLILSNAPRRSASAIARMRDIGIPDDLYDGVFTSGESANLALRRRDDDWHGRLGRRCYLLGPPEDDSALEDVPDSRAPALADADYILGIGSFERTDTVGDYEEFLAEAKDRGLPMVCANPDLEVLRGGVPEICAGAIAERYEAMGGDVFWHGKPFAGIYRQSLERLGVAPPAAILAVGDALRTDVAGAAAAGIDSLFITSGLEARRLGVAPGERPDPDAFAQLVRSAAAAPTYADVHFRWEAS